MVIEEVIQWAEWIEGAIRWGGAVGGAALAFYNWVAKPIKKKQKEDDAIRQAILDEIKSMKEAMQTVQDDVADILGNELEIVHNRFMEQRWCTASEKQRYADLHDRYKKRGHNHVSASFERDLLELPEAPPYAEG